MNKNKEKEIPIVIITRMNGDEFWNIWGQQAKGIWILSDNKVKDFNELNSIIGASVLDWSNFKKNKFNVPGEKISALVLNGYTEPQKPHQLEVIWHLLFKENCKNSFVLIHRGEGNLFSEGYYPNRFLNNTNLIEIEGRRNNSNHLPHGILKFNQNKRTIPYFDYSIGGGTPVLKKLGGWITTIAEGIKHNNYKCAVERLNELYKLLENYKEKFDENIVTNSQSKPCFSLDTLKHRITHLWLPIDIDLQGIMECWNDGRKDNAQKYLEEVLEDKKDKVKDQNGNPTYYWQKLADTRYLILGDCRVNGIDGPSPKIKNFREKKVNDKSLKETLGDSEKLKELYSLIGLTYQEENNPNSVIFKFCSTIHSMIEKYITNIDSINYSDVRTIIDFNFSDWYQRLNEKLNELK